MTEIRLRPTRKSDVATFFTHMLDEEARHMAAFTAKDSTDEKAYEARWERILNNPDIIPRTIEFEGKIAGHVASFPMDGRVEVTYWIDSAFWGRGVATGALRAFLEENPARPLHAHVATDNLGSRRVLEKCGFEVIDQERGFAEARGEEIDELLLVLRT